jgi:hypothetical protein
MTHGERAMLFHVCDTLMKRPDKAHETLVLIDEFSAAKAREFRLAIFRLRRSEHPGDTAAEILKEMTE